ncbi:MAG: phage holin family protein [Clostridiales bacterium]|nr:phage holin family protein [Clostridiales bacterium]
MKVLAAIGGAIAGLFGGFDTMMMVLVACMVIDYATGLIVAWMGKSQKTESGHLDSKVGFVGIGKKALMILVVLMAALLDRALGGEAAIFRTAMIWFYVANEGLSILENLSLAGVPFPRVVLNALEQLKQKHDEPPDVGA